MSAPEPGEEIATGRTAKILAWSDGRVVKRFNSDVAACEIDHEERDSKLAHQLGLTPIACHGQVALSGGATGLVFDRLGGHSLANVAERDPRKIPEVARRLAREHASLHKVASDDFPDVREHTAALLDAPQFADFSDGERSELRAAVLALPPGNRVLHLDFHPLNVFEHHGGHAVIDWQSTCKGDPAADAAMTVFLFTEAELFPGLSRLQRVVYQTVRRVMLRSYLREYLTTDVTRDEIEQWRTAIRILRLGTLNIASERGDLVHRIRTSLAASPT